MTRYLLDTNHAGRLLRDGSHSLWQRLATLRRDECLLCRPVVAELWFMVFNSQHLDTNQTRLQSLLQQFDILEFDESSAIEFGRLRAALRRLGKPVPAFDVLIAAIALTHHCTLVTADTHFSQIPPLTLDNWLS